MCNVAGYAGERRAAPILIELMKRQEGFGGGYYTGIATIAGGKLHYAKVIGDVKTLVEETDAEDLPGTVGIIHSRSKSGGDEEWGHPFLSCDGQMAYIANGHGGFFEEKRDKNAVAQRLLDAGHTFYSRCEEQIGNYPVLADGSSVHSSEVMCCLIESRIGEEGPVEATRRAFMDFPAEIVGLMVHAESPDCVVASRISQPLMIGQSPSGMYLSTTALAFFEEADINWISPMPVNAVAAVYKDRISLIPFDPPPGKVSEIFPWTEGYKKVIELLSTSDKALGLGAFKNATAPLWDEDAVPQKDMMVYEILRSLYAEGRIDFTIVPVEGVQPGTTAPKKRVYLTS